MAFMCTSLHRLGLLLEAAYTRRDTAIENKDMAAIAEAELTLRRVHNLITHHRSFCRRCPFNDALSRIPPKTDNPSSDVTPINLAS